MAMQPDFDARWDYNDPAGTEQKFRTLLLEHQDAAPAGWRAELMTQIARTLGLQKAFEEADALLDAAKPLAENDPRVMARWLLERGRVRNSSGRKEEAIPLFEQALGKADEAGAEFFAIDAAHMLGIATTGDTQMRWHREGLARAERAEDPKARNWRGSLLNNLGWTLHDAERYEEALEAFRQALGAREAEGNPERIQIAKWCVARCLRSLGRTQEALEMQLALAAEHAAAGTDDPYVQEEIAACRTALGT